MLTYKVDCKMLFIFQDEIDLPVVKSKRTFTDREYRHNNYIPPSSNSGRQPTERKQICQRSKMLEELIRQMSSPEVHTDFIDEVSEILLCIFFFCLVTEKEDGIFTFSFSLSEWYRISLRWSIYHINSVDKLIFVFHFPIYTAPQFLYELNPFVQCSVAAVSGFVRCFAIVTIRARL